MNKSRRKEIEARLLALALAGYTQEKMADAAGLSFSAVHRFCRRLRLEGRMAPSARRQGWSAPQRRQHPDSDDHKKPLPEREWPAKRRLCLRCQTVIESSWPGERVCAHCRKSADWRTGAP